MKKKISFNNNTSVKVLLYNKKVKIGIEIHIMFFTIQIQFQ